MSIIDTYVHSDNTEYEIADSATRTRVSAVEGKIPSGASSSNKMATASDITTVTNGVIANTKLIKDTVGWSGKNLLEIKAVTRTLNGVTLTIQDGIVTLNGTATASNQINLNDTSGLLNSLTQKYGDLILNGSPALTNCRLYTHINGGSYVTSSNGDETPILASTDYDQTILLQFDNGATFNNVQFKPMLRPKYILDNSFESYFDSTAFPRSEQAMLGAKNLLLNVQPTSFTNNSVTYTKNSDDSVVINGTSGSGNSYYTINYLANDNHSMALDAKPFVGKRMKFSFTDVGVSGLIGIVGYFPTGSNTFNQLAETTTKTSAFVIPSNADKIAIFFRVEASISVDNKTVFPMLMFADDTDDTYVPYAMTNRELTEDRYFHVGETVNVSLTNFSALLTASAKEIRCTIPFMKSLAKVTGISFKSSTTIAVRKPSGGYLIDGLISGYTVSVVSIKENLLCFKLEKTDSSAFDGDNNSCMDLAFTGGANDSVITFS